MIFHPTFRAKRTKELIGFLLIRLIFRDFTQEKNMVFMQYRQGFRRFAKNRKIQIKILPIAKKMIE